MLLRLAYLGVTNVFALLRLLPHGDRDKDIEILSLRHRLAILQRQLDGQQVRFEPADRAWLAALLHPLPRSTLRGPRLLVRPDTILKWHRDLIARRHALLSQPRRPGRPRTPRSIRLLVLRLAPENPGWVYRRMHGELLTLGIMVAPSTVWEILREAGMDPAPDRAATTWADFLRSQAEALLAADFIETVTLTGTRTPAPTRPCTPTCRRPAERYRCRLCRLAASRPCGRHSAPGRHINCLSSITRTPAPGNARSDNGVGP